MKRPIAVLLAATLTLSTLAASTLALAGCTSGGSGASGSLDGGASSAGDSSTDSSTGGSITVVTTIFPLYDWCREIVGDTDGIDIAMLLDTGTDLHSYQPTVDDMASISECDLFMFVGGESDSWTIDAIASAGETGRVDLSMMDVLADDVLTEEEAGGMQSEDADTDAAADEDAAAADDADATEDAAAADNAAADDDDEADEHVWLSLANAQVLCSAIADALGEVDPGNADTYASNAEAYCAELRDLDSRYAETVEAADIDTLVFCDRFPFRYLVDDYGLSYYAAFSGCSAETEASFETVAYLAERVDELSLSHVVTIEGSDASIADTVIASTESQDAEVVELDSMQSVTAADVDVGATYLDTMERNLDALAEALS